MKKSEMIKIIKHILTVPRMDYCERDPNEHWEMVASEVMTAIEHNGMLPPSINGVVETEALEDGSIVVYPWKWEPEDEKK